METKNARKKKTRKKNDAPTPTLHKRTRKKLLIMEFHINWYFFIIIIPWQIQQKLYFFRNVEIFNYSFICKDQNFVKENIESSTNYIFWMKNSKLINYATNICWSCQDTTMAHYVFTNYIYIWRKVVCLFCSVVTRST